jgi:hypothetical protein
MIELQWALPPGTSTKPPVLQYRLAVALDARKCLGDGAVAADFQLLEQPR